MSDDDLKERMNAALNTAKNSAAGHLHAIAQRYLPDIKTTGYVKVCPCCKNDESKFRVYPARGGHWIWGCFRETCYGNFASNDVKHDALGLVAEMEGLDWMAARDRYLEICGVPNPFKEAREAKEERDRAQKRKAGGGENLEIGKVESREEEDEKSEAGGREEEESAAVASVAIVATLQADDPDEIPGVPQNVLDFTLADGPLPPPPEDVPPTVWEDVYELLKLDLSDSVKLKLKRGFTPETIRLAGYRSSTHGNRVALAPILDKYPHPLLLSLGIASKDPDTQEVKINAQLTGLGLIKRGEKVADDEWGWCSPILIPYRNSQGKVISIRPHKGGLSGKRFMQEYGYERAFRSTRTRTLPYTNWLFHQRPEKWGKACVLTEGEFKADALAQCGIPAMAVPGIQMPKNKIFFEEMVETLRKAGVREITVCYDNEDKSHKPDPWTRYESEVWAEYACDALRSAGFTTRFCLLPDNWRDESGKADWDGVLARHKTIEGFTGSASAAFHAVLKTARYYNAQAELFGVDEKQRIKHCKLNRLRLEPTILTGGEEEEELAKLLLNTKDPWRMPLAVRDLAKELRDTRGCYYVRKRLDAKSLKPYFAYYKEIKKELQETPPEDLEKTAEMEAAMAAVKHIIEGRPDILSDFTIQCDFQVRTQSGVIHKLFRFKNKHGQISELITVPPSACSTSTKFREFCMGVGNFNPIIGDKQIQQLMIDIGTFSAWREIRELEMIGRDAESGLWIFGDCAFADGATPGDRSAVYFADKHEIIWHNGIGYRIDPNDLREFAHKEAPKFFQKRKVKPAEVLKEILKDPAREKIEVAKIFFQLAADLIATFGDSTGLLVLGTMLGYSYAPELLTDYNGHPGLWVHGRAFSGKTETLRFLMQMWGYDPGYRNVTLSSGSTNVGIDRPLAQYSDIPLHLDEFRQAEADKNRISTLRMAFNRQAKSKGKMDQTNRTRSVQPHTSPIITGEGVTNDSATLSRYVEAVLSAAKRLGNPDQQRARYQRMKGQASGYHRIVRWVLLNRKQFAHDAMQELDAFLDSTDVTSTVLSDRVRLTYGSAFAALKTVYEDLFKAFMTAQATDELGEFQMSAEDLLLLSKRAVDFRDFTISAARNAAADVASINMVVQFWTDVMIAHGRAPNNSGIKRFMWFEWCKIDPETNRVTRTNARYDTDGLVRCLIVKSGELYAEYELDTRQRNREPELSVNNIRGECQSERFWVPAPKNSKHRSHRMSFEGLGQISVWVLRCDRMEPSLQNVFMEQFEKDQDDESPELAMAGDEKSPI